MSRLPGKFVWFEHVSSDIAKARKFYEPLFGWHTEAMPAGKHRYPVILNHNREIGGYRRAATGARPHWLGYVSVDDVDATYRRAVAAGARSLQAPADHPAFGRGATIADRSGAVVSLWRSLEGDPPDMIDAPSGNWAWNELWTHDEMGALAFYQQVFGYTHESMDLGRHGTYYILRRNGAGRGGVIRSAEPAAPAMWLPYVGVDDCDATCAKACKLGGEVLTGPADIAGVGRFAVLVDTVGAAVAVIKALPAGANEVDTAVAQATAA